MVSESMETDKKEEYLTSLNSGCVTRPELSEKLSGCQRWNWRPQGEESKNIVKKHNKKLMALIIRNKS